MAARPVSACRSRVPPWSAREVGEASRSKSVGGMEVEAEAEETCRRRARVRPAGPAPMMAMRGGEDMAGGL